MNTTTSLEDVLRPLRAARRRWTMQQLLSLSATLLLAAGSILVVLAAVNRWLLDARPWDWTITAEVAGGALVLALLVTLARRKSLKEMAGFVDRLGNTRDRFFTALSFAKGSEPSPMRELAFAECARFVRGGEFARLIPVRFPRQIFWLLAPALTIAFLQWDGAENHRARVADEKAARAAVEKTASKLEELARQTQKANEENKSDQLRKLAEQLQRSADQLRANPGEPGEANKAALRELSALEQMIQEMQKTPPAGISPEEMKALAEALKEQDATKDAAAAMAAGDAAKAAEELEKAMQQAAEQKDERTPEQIQQSLQQALQKLAQQKQLSEAAQKLAQQMQQAQQSGGNSSESAKQLAQMLRQMAQGKSGQQSSKPGQQSAQTMEKMLSALQNMKFGDGEQQPAPDGPPQQGPSGGTMMQSFGKSGESQPGMGDPQSPSGQPGGERDFGTTESPFGKEQNAAGKEAQQKQVAGRQGEGESMQQSLLSAGDTSKSKRGYRQLYDAMAPAAQEAVMQENIPLGSRFFIKRYFESIRPQE